MGSVDLSYMMANSYSISYKTWKWPKKLFFQLPYLTILKAFIIHASCEGKLTHKLFQEQLVGDLIHVVPDINPHPSTSSCGRPPSREICHCHFNIKDSNHWPAKGCSQTCDVCSSQGKASMSFYVCEDCDIGIHVYLCFKLNHTTLYYWVTLRVKSDLEQWSPLMHYKSSSHNNSDSFQSVDSVKLSGL
jgi:hypothetical protein